jgi:ElaB/YqjD/DUF883 family membrane-anchored ribosome-binding protein
MSRINEPNTGGQSGAAAQLKDKAGEMADSLKSAATEQFEHARDTAEEYYNTGREKAQEWQHSLEDYVQEQPVKALLIAAGVGMLFGIIWKKS